MNQHQDGPVASAPGSTGERELQEELGTGERARRFYDEQLRDRLNERMREFIGRQEMFFLSTADAKGTCDSTFRAGPPGFLVVLDDRTVAYPEYRGNGVLASLGNIKENPHVGMLLMDFGQERIGLHVNGRARLVSDELMRIRRPDLPADPVPGRRPQIWVAVDIEEAYVHCAKHIPHLVKADSSHHDWGIDDARRKGGDYFGAAAERAADHSAPPRHATSPAAGGAHTAVTPAHGRPAHVTPAHGRPAHVTPVSVAPVRVAPAAGGTQAAAEDTAPEPHPPGVTAVPNAMGERARLAVRSRADRAGLPDPDMWRREAERALARAHARGPEPAAGPLVPPAPPVSGEAFSGWFG